MLKLKMLKLNMQRLDMLKLIMLSLSMLKLNVPKLTMLKLDMQQLDVLNILKQTLIDMSKRLVRHLNPLMLDTQVERTCDTCVMCSFGAR